MRYILIGLATLIFGTQLMQCAKAQQPIGLIAGATPASGFSNGQCAVINNNTVTAGACGGSSFPLIVPANSSITGTNATPGSTDTAGSDYYVNGSQSTGSAYGGAVKIQMGTAGSSGTQTNPLVDTAFWGIGANQPQGALYFGIQAIGLDNADYLGFWSGGGSNHRMMAVNGFGVSTNTGIGFFPDTYGVNPNSSDVWLGRTASGVAELTNGQSGSTLGELRVAQLTAMLPIAAPASPSAGWTIYTDTVDGKLKAKSSAGVVVVLTP